jgi:hypothetical protein
MPAPTSAQLLPTTLPNASQPLASVEYELQPGDLMDGSGKPVTGTLRMTSNVTPAWKYLFGTFPQRSSTVDPTFSLTAGATYSQAQVQQLADQVAALSALLGKKT